MRLRGSNLVAQVLLTVSAHLLCGSNPLDPSYVHHGTVVSDEPGAHYVPKYHERRGGTTGTPAPFLPLTTTDIEGAYPGAGVAAADSRLGGPFVTNFLGDIPGSHAGSHRSGLPERSILTDPNARDYLLLDGTRSSQVYAAGGVGQSAYLAAAAELAGTGGADGEAAPVRRRVRVDPRDSEIIALRRQVEQLMHDKSSNGSPEGGVDRFLALAAASEKAVPTRRPVAGATGHAVALAAPVPGSSVEGRAPDAVAAPPRIQCVDQGVAAAAASPAALPSSLPVPPLVTAPLSPRNQSASSDTEVVPSSIWPLKDSKSPRPTGRVVGSTMRQAGVASVSAIATGHAASSDAAPVKFSQMSKAMVLAKKSAGPAVLALPAAVGGGIRSGGGAYAAGLSARLASMARSSEIAAVRGLPG